MGSSRFPGKVTEKIWKDYDSVTFLIERLKGQYPIILAIPDTKENDCLELHTNYNNVFCFRGDEQKPFNRIYDLYKFLKKDDPYEDFSFVEITADCPLVPANLVTEYIDIFHEKKYHYLSNTITRSYPDGFDIQIYNARLLNLVNLFISKKHRQHVGWNIVNYSGQIESLISGNIRMVNMTAPTEYNYPSWNLTLDYPEDLEVIKAFLNKRKSLYFDEHDVIAFYKNHPELLEKSNLPRNIPGE
jgi:spore coat polysaccharide biosynthesis protein SpsF